MITIEKNMVTMEYEVYMEYEAYKDHIKSLLADIRKAEDESRKLKKEIDELKHFKFETKNYHGEVRKDFTFGWFEHIEYGEDGGCGNFDIELTDTTWEIVDTDGCYDVPSEIVEMLEDRIKKPLTQS